MKLDTTQLLFCTRCQTDKPLTDFDTTINMIREKRPRNRKDRICKACSKLSRKTYYYDNQEKILEKKRDNRQIQENAAKYILKDIRSHGFEVDPLITEDWLQERLKEPCFYCGRSDIKRSMDKIDTNKSYLIDNINISCLRCNLLRSDMPYDAWLIVLKGVIAADKAGDFKDWLPQKEKFNYIWA